MLRELLTVILYLSSNRKGGPGEFRVQNDPIQVTRPDSTSGLYYHNGIYDMRNAIRFRVWTRENPVLANEIVVHDLHSLRTSTYNAQRLTKIFVHGKDHRSNEQRLDPETVYLRDAFLRFGDVNFVLVDWTEMAKTVRYFTNYGDIVTDRLVDFLRFIERHGTPLSTVHMMGLSWGAHVAGNAGHKLGGRIGRITALDAAGPFFTGQPLSRILDKSDALFVDFIHTDAGPSTRSHSGIPGVFGHVDFFPNGGKGQPGCPPVHWRFHRELPCSHERAIDLFAESIGSPLSFPSCEKDDLECGENDNVTYMGLHLPVTTRGVYYLKTGGSKPFGTGLKMDLILPSIPGVKRARNVVFDFTRFRFNRLNSAYQENNNNNHNNSNRARSIELGITKTETNFSPSNHTNIEFLPNYKSFTPSTYPNSDILMQSLLIQKKLLKKT